MSNKTNTALQAPTRPNSFDYDDLLECAHGKMFGPENGKLPMPPMLMIDRIPHISREGGKFGKGEIRAELDIRFGQGQVHGPGAAQGQAGDLPDRHQARHHAKAEYGDRRWHNVRRRARDLHG